MPEVVREILSRAGIQIKSYIKPIGIGYNQLFDIDDEFIVRLGTSEDGEYFPKSASILRQLQGKAKVPIVVCEDFSKTHVPYNVMILTKVKGQLPCEVWRNLPGSKRERVIEDLCDQMRVIHTLDYHANPFIKSEDSFHIRDFHIAESKFHAAMSTGRISPQKLGAIWTYVQENSSILSAYSPLCLTHSDLHLNNILLHGDQIAALIDFEDSCLGSPFMDLFNFVDPVHLSAWEELHQDSFQLFKWVTRYYPEPFRDARASCIFKLYCLMEALYDFAPSERSPIDDLLSGNLRYRAVLVDHVIDRFMQQV